MPPTPIVQIEKALNEAAARIAEQYILLPIDGGEPVYRERLYCYELYHQLRCALGDNFEYSVGGEIDKSAHPRMRGPGVTRKKPDLLVHRPGDMESNLLVIEVKPVDDPGRAKITKDLQTLTGYHTFGGYKNAWYLIYGGSEHNVRRFCQICVRIAEEQHDPPINLDSIQLLWHRGTNFGIARIPWKPE